jgi:RND family efflux transporter MFP subunit
MTMRKAMWLLVSLASIVVVPLRAPGGAPAAPEVILLQKCPIEYERITEIGANHQTGSMIQELTVEPGDLVKANQVLGSLFNQDAVAELAAAQAKVEVAKIDAQSKRWAAELEKANLARYEMLNNKKTAMGTMISAQDLQIQTIKVKTALLDADSATKFIGVTEGLMQQSKADVVMRNLVSPHDGVVIEIYKRAGETVGPMSPIVRVVKVDRMKVTGYLDATDAWRVRRGAAVKVVPELDGASLPIDKQVFTGKVTFVDSEIDPKTRTCRVYAVVDNPQYLLRSGLECRMEIFPDPPGPTASR